MKLLLAQVNGAAIDFDNDTLKCAIVTAGSGAPDTGKTGIEFLSDVLSGNAEVTGTGYARQTLAGVTVAFDGSANLVDFSFTTITFDKNAAGFDDGAYVIFFKDTGSAATSQVFVVFIPDATLDVTGGDLDLDAPTGGMIQWNQAA
jgi:hypothetical protein